MRKLIKRFRLKYKEAVAEIKDLNYEHNRERAELFETVQDYEKDTSLYKEIMRKMINEKELSKIVNKCEYDVDNKKWSIPMFSIKDKQVELPKMPSNMKS